MHMRPVALSLAILCSCPAGVAAQAGVGSGTNAGIGPFRRTFEGCEGVADRPCDVNPEVAEIEARHCPAEISRDGWPNPNDVTTRPAGPC